MNNLDTTTTIRSRAELETWLAGNGWFADSFAVRLHPTPRPGVLPSEVTLEIGVQIDGGYETGETRTLRLVRLRGTGVRAWQIDNARAWDANHCIEAIYLLDVPEGVGISFDAPGRVVLVCSELAVTELPDRSEIIQPFVTDYEISVMAPGAGLPSPAEWIEWFRERGVAVAWRQVGSAETPADRVPANYTGWFLQRPERIADVPYGLFFFHCEERPGRVILHLQDQNVDDRPLWAAVGGIVASFPGVEIRSGNCRLTGEQWAQYLREGKIG